MPNLGLELGWDRFHHKKPNNPITQDFLQHHINWEIGCYIDMVNRVGRRYFPRCQIYIRPLWFLSNIWIIQGHLTDMQIWQEHYSPSPRNLAGTYFASVCAMAIPFIVKNVPETKGKTLEEIQASINCGTWVVWRKLDDTFFFALAIVRNVYEICNEDVYQGS